MKVYTNDSLSVEEAASTFAALGSEQRLLVLRSLVRAGPEGLNIGELGKRCGVTGSTLTHHMKILTQAGLVTQKKQGRSIICAGASYRDLEALLAFVLSDCCADTEHPHSHDLHLPHGESLPSTDKAETPDG